MTLTAKGGTGLVAVSQSWLPQPPGPGAGVSRLPAMRFSISGLPRCASTVWIGPCCCSRTAEGCRARSPSKDSRSVAACRTIPAPYWPGPEGARSRTRDRGGRSGGKGMSRDGPPAAEDGGEARKAGGAAAGGAGEGACGGDSVPRARSRFGVRSVDAITLPCGFRRKTPRSPGSISQQPIIRRSAASSGGGSWGDRLDCSRDRAPSALRSTCCTCPAMPCAMTLASVRNPSRSRSRTVVSPTQAPPSMRSEASRATQGMTSTTRLPGAGPAIADTAWAPAAGRRPAPSRRTEPDFAVSRDGCGGMGRMSSRVLAGGACPTSFQLVRAPGRQATRTSDLVIVAA